MVKIATATVEGNCKKYESKLVVKDKLLAYLDDSLDIMMKLSNGKMVIRKPLAVKNRYDLLM
ncbi:MAG: hypothetical protein QXJ75_03450 [Candidatus Bathyarchaeia archaeon]